MLTGSAARKISAALLPLSFAVSLPACRRSETASSAGAPSSSRPKPKIPKNALLPSRRADVLVEVTLRKTGCVVVDAPSTAVDSPRMSWLRMGVSISRTRSTDRFCCTPRMGRPIGRCKSEDPRLAPSSDPAASQWIQKAVSIWSTPEPT
jgi:hypothetical protein